MAETTRTAPDAPAVPRRPAGEQPQGERQTVTIAGKELEVEPPTPTQEEADAMKEQAMTGGQQPAQAPENETPEQRQERETRERQQRDQRPGAAGAGYQTR